MRALGAELDVIPSVEGRPNVTAQDIQNMVARAAELARRSPATTRPTSSTTRTSSRATATSSAARSGSRPAAA